MLKCFAGLRQQPHRNEHPMNCKKGTRTRARRTVKSDGNHAVALRRHGLGFPSFLYAPVQMLTALKLHSLQRLFKLTYQQPHKGIWRCFRRMPRSHFAWDNAPQTWLLLTNPSLIDHEMLNNLCGTTPGALHAVLLCH